MPLSQMSKFCPYEFNLLWMWLSTWQLFLFFKTQVARYSVIYLENISYFQIFLSEWILCYSLKVMFLGER